MTRRSLPFGALAVMYLAVVGLFTLGPTLWRTRPASGDYDVLSLSTWLDSDTWVRIGSPEFVANILLFVPLGLLLRLAIPRVTWLGATVLGGAVSVAIEVLQAWTPRVSDPRDIVANTLGTLAGALLAALLAAVVGLLLGLRGSARDRRVSARVGVTPPAVSRPAGRPVGRPGAG